MPTLRPATPTLNAITVTGPYSLSLSWVDNTNYQDPGAVRPDLWEVQLSTSHLFTDSSTLNFTVAPASNVTLATENLTQDTFYYARVRGKNVFFEPGDWSNEKTARTLFLISDRVTDASKQPLIGRIFVVDWASLANWQSGSIPILAHGDSNAQGQFSASGNGSSSPLAVLVLDPEGMKPGNVYGGL
jgi:hypothetical protein